MTALVSHDLRTPLQTIATAAELLKRQPPPETMKRSLNSITVATSQIDRLLRDLLDISLIDSGELSLRREITDTASLITEVYALFEPVATRKKLRFSIAIDPDLPDVWIDRHRILQALSNVLSNAMKFVSAGGCVSLSAARRDRGVQITVDDDGIGIAPEHLAHVFDRLWRGPDQSEHGAGLGLAVTRGIIEAHGGSVTVASGEGRGTRFCLQLEPAPRLAH
jgi:signal transduction histidine kinase